MAANAPIAMNIRAVLPAVVLASLAAGLRADSALPHDNYVVDHRQSPHAVLRPLPYDAVQWTDGFWADRYRQLAEVTLNESWRLLADPNEGHVLDNFRIAAGRAKGEYAGTTWQDEWAYKWLEAAACVWRNTRDAALARKMEEAIELIAAAQEPDGYLSTMVTIKRVPRFQIAQDHELYNMGHLINAGVVHARMTGRDNLLKVARQAADFLCANVGTTVQPFMAHNPSALMGLVELYRLTGERKYLDCAQLIIDRRGTKPRVQGLFKMKPEFDGLDYIQDRVPVRKSTEVVGHNVFFTYLYTGCGDLFAERGDGALDTALGRLWTDLVDRKMFIHGGVSALPHGLSHNGVVGEAVGAAYELPNATCYNETCGQIGALMWGYRMLVNHPDAQFADVMEREMYNGFLPALGLEGKMWFYRNVLRRYDAAFQPTGNDMSVRRQPGRREICCPSNYLRAIAELSAYFYSLDDAGVWVHHYGGSKVNGTLLSGERFALEQITDYPWSGDVRIVIRQAPDKSLALRLRVPGWASGAALPRGVMIPGGTTSASSAARADAGPPGMVLVNGKKIDAPVVERGYLTIAQRWRTGDSITLHWPLEPQLVTADPRVEETRNQVAVMRGPVLYCLESPDLPAGVDIASVHIPNDAVFKPNAGIARCAEPLAKKSVVLRGQVLHRLDPRSGPLYRPLSREPLQPVELTLIPYYAWANRGAAAMTVWFPVVWKTSVASVAGTN